MSGHNTDKESEFLVSFDNDRKILWTNIMDGYNTDRKYESSKIPDRQEVQSDGAIDGLPLSNSEREATVPALPDSDADSSTPAKVTDPVSSDSTADSSSRPKAAAPASSDSTADSSSRPKAATPVSSSESYFYEIEYDSNPVPGVGRFVLKPQQIEPPVKDEIRDLFAQMKDISRAHHSSIDYSRFFDRRVYNDNAFIFYKQGMFMKDFTDDYKDTVPFSTYFPYYQLMGYEQLRTYFTWRTEVRKGNIADVSLSYAFLYIYELLNNIGFDSPQDALDNLMHFWKIFSVYNSAIDRYMLRWLKDYHIYYELSLSFKEFVDQNDLAMHYPKLVDNKNNFDFFCTISKYDIRKSVFFTEGRGKLVTDCFYFVVDKIRQILLGNGMDFDASMFQPTRKISAWKPFRDALFYQCIKQPDKRIVISENELYICHQNTWTFSKELTSGSDRALVGYIMKKMESVLRQAAKYNAKLTANITAVNHEMIVKLVKHGLSLDKIISDAVFEFYREVNRTVVRVDHENLSKIRQDALSIQQKLIVPDQGEPFVSVVTPVNPVSLDLQKKLFNPSSDTEQTISNLQKPTSSQSSESTQGFSGFSKTELSPSSGNETASPYFQQKAFNPSSDNKQVFSDFQKAATIPPFDISVTPVRDVWESFKNALTPTEKKALSILLSGNTQMKKFADECGIMLEVLIDGINEKAMDFISDNIIDEEFVIYDEYKDKTGDLVI